MKIAIPLISLIILISSCCSTTSVASISREPEPFKGVGPGDIWLSLQNESIEMDKPFKTYLRINTGEEKIGAYSVILFYDKDLLMIDTSVDNEGILPGPDGSVAAVNLIEPGQFMISGFDVSGMGPGEAITIGQITWKGKGQGKTQIQVKAEILINGAYENIGNPLGYALDIVIQ